jgi:peptidyl-prolyl cis-trans isomerase A (cyclophilin A)
MILRCHRIYGKDMRVKWYHFILLAGTADAALLANFQTSRGTVIIDLQYTKAPQTVANFITLAQGTRSWADPASGAVKTIPFYNGTVIHRTENTNTFKIAQGGTRTGNGSEGPGYSFKDEFHATLTHLPYVFSMANSGPNTNGSQFFFTGNVSIPSLNNVHTVFGLVSDPASRAVIDAMLSAGAGATSITGITFSRTDAPALAFNEFSEKLPNVYTAQGRLEATRYTASQFLLNSSLPAGTIASCFRSTNLQTWTKISEFYQDPLVDGGSSLTLDDASLPKAFYNLHLVNYPDALGPELTANRTLVVSLLGTQTFTYQFNASGTGGTAVYSENPSLITPITGISYQPSAHRANWIISTAAYVPLRFKGALNTSNASHILGTNTSEQWNGYFWNPLSNGTLSLTK